MSKAQLYIDQFNRLHGKKIYKSEVNALLNKVKAAKLDSLKELEKRLTRTADKMKSLKLSSVEIVIKEPMKLAAKMPVKKVTKVVAKVRDVVTKPVEKLKRKVTALNGVVDASAIAGLNFSKIDLDGKWKDKFLKMYSDTQMMFWGKPGHGKTVDLLQFAQYLAEKKHLKVLFIANEEMNRSTLTEKIISFKIGHSNLKFAKDLDSLKVSGMSITDFDAVFFDSIQSIGFTLDKYKDFVKHNPGRIYILVAQSTKDGNFRGGQDWEHEVDIAGEYINRKLILRKNRLDSEFSKKSDKLLIDEKVNEGKKRFEIKQQINQSLPKVDADKKVKEEPVTVIV